MVAVHRRAIVSPSRRCSSRNAVVIAVGVYPIEAEAFQRQVPEVALAHGGF